MRLLKLVSWTQSQAVLQRYHGVRAHHLQVMTESVRLHCQLLMLDKNKPPLHHRLINAEELTQLTIPFDDHFVSEQ